MNRSPRRSVLCVLALIAFSGASAEPPVSDAHAGNKEPIFPKGPDRDLVARVCTPCHAPEQVVAKHRTVEEWDTIIGRMLDRGAQATDAEQDRILGYLVRFYGPEHP